MSICNRRLVNINITATLPRPNRFQVQQLSESKRTLLPQPVHLTRRFNARLAKPVNLAMYPHHTTPAHVSKVLVFGAGNFGSCLADHLGDSEHEVHMWSRDAKFVKHFNFHHRNPEYLKDHLFSHNIQAVGPDLPDKKFIRSMDVLLFAIPTQAVRYAYLRDIITYEI